MTPGGAVVALRMVGLTAALTGAALWLWPARAQVAPRAPVVPPPAVAAVPPIGGAEPADASLAARVAWGNPFAASRTPPRSRWLPPDLALGDATVSDAPAVEPALAGGDESDGWGAARPHDGGWSGASAGAEALPERASLAEAGRAPPVDPVEAGRAPPVEPAEARAGDRESEGRRGAARVPALFGTVIGEDGARALLRLDPAIAGAQLYAEGAEAGGWRVARVEPGRVVLVGRKGRRELRLPRRGDAGV